jgi:hypothetical protein
VILRVIGDTKEKPENEENKNRAFGELVKTMMKKQQRNVDNARESERN